MVFIEHFVMLLQNSVKFDLPGVFLSFRIGSYFPRSQPPRAEALRLLHEACRDSDFALRLVNRRTRTSSVVRLLVSQCSCHGLC